MDDISFDDTPLEEQAAPADQASVPPPPAASVGTSAPPNGVPDPVSPATATTSGIAYITVSDASGRVLFRRPATGAEVDEALRAADEAEREGQAAMDRIASERFLNEALEGNTPA